MDSSGSPEHQDTLFFEMAPKAVRKNASGE